MGKKKSKGKRRRQVQQVITPSQAQKQLPQLKHALSVKTKEEEAIRKNLSLANEALNALKLKTEDGQKRELDLQRENAELARKLEQAEEAAAAHAKALEAERAIFDGFDLNTGQRDEMLLDLKDLAQKNKVKLIREQERFANYKKRSARQREDAHEQGRLDMLNALLPIIDDIERPVEKLPQELRETSWWQGVDLLHKNLYSVLEKYNVQAITPTAGDAFCPDIHESAAAEQNDELGSDRIVETIRKGYRAGNRLLRPALVKVSR